MLALWDLEGTECRDNPRYMVIWCKLLHLSPIWWNNMITIPNLDWWIPAKLFWCQDRAASKGSNEKQRFLETHHCSCLIIDRFQELTLWISIGQEDTIPLQSNRCIQRSRSLRVNAITNSQSIYFINIWLI